MVADASPRKTNNAGFLESDRIKTLDLPQDGCLRKIAKSIEEAMKAGKTADVRNACAEKPALGSTEPRTTAFVCLLPDRCEFAAELFSNYTPETMLIRVLMRTAVRK